MRSLVEVKDLVKVYQKKDQKNEVIANAGLTFSVFEGECVGILGPNGSGKTTLVRQLIGFLSKTKGEIRIFGKNYETAGQEIRKKLGYMMQNRYSHWDHLTVAQALNFSGQLKKLTSHDITWEKKRLLEKFGLISVKNWMIRQLSGGNKQAVSLAITLIGQPKLVILDEPSSGLDPIKRQQLWELLDEINRENQSTILIVSHNPMEIERVATRVLIMDKGKIIEMGSISEIKDRLSNEARVEISLMPQTEGRDLGVQMNEFSPIFLDGKIIFHCQRHQLGKILERLTPLEGWKNIADFEIINPSLEDIYIKAIGSKME